MAEELGDARRASSAPVPSSVKVSLSAVAVGDLDRLGRFLGERNPAAAVRAAKTIADAIASIGQMPGRGASTMKGARRLSVAFGRGAYLIDYRVDHQEAVTLILRIRHSREAR